MLTKLLFHVETYKVHKANVWLFGDHLFKFRRSVDELTVVFGIYFGNSARACTAFAAFALVNSNIPVLAPFSQLSPTLTHTLILFPTHPP